MTCTFAKAHLQARNFTPMFSKAFGYALRAITYIALHCEDGKRVSLQELSEHLAVPHHFLGKIMQDLVHHGIIDSAKGPTGGFFVNAHTCDYHLIEVLKITDDSRALNSCVMGIRHCNAKRPCPLHNDFASCRNGMIRALEEKTVRMLAEDVKAGGSFLIRE